MPDRPVTMPPADDSPTPSPGLDGWEGDMDGIRRTLEADQLPRRHRAGPAGGRGRRGDGPPPRHRHPLAQRSPSP